jgi:hypothetical protein
VKYNQRIQAEREWLARATEWAREHPDATAEEAIAALPNPHKLLVRPLAGAALAAATAGDRNAEDRRRQYEATHPRVKIWHDAGGWHARWPVNGTHTGISHPVSLGTLLDRLDTLGTREEETAG